MKYCLLTIAAFLIQSFLSAAEGQTLRMMSFNVRYSAANDGLDGWNNRKEFLLETIKDFQPSLLGTQEVLDDQREFLAAKLPEYTCIGVGRDDGKKAGEYSTIFVKKSEFDIQDSGTFWLSETPTVPGSKSWNTACTRVVTWARLKDKAGLEFMYINTHWDHRSDKARQESAKLMRKWLGEHGNLPVVVTGDFNCIEDDPAYAVLLAKDDAKLPLTDAYREVHPERSKEEASFHAFKGNALGSRIDWILHSKELKATDAQIDRRKKNERYPSDHFAVTAVLEWTAAGKN
jgi:endonuclease/exonuclease/phosphatase family metal-dependent hydrolase